MSESPAFAELQRLLGWVERLFGAAAPAADAPLDAWVAAARRAVPTTIPRLDQDLLDVLGQLTTSGSAPLDALLPALIDGEGQLRPEAAPRFTTLTHLPEVRHLLCRHLDEPDVGVAVAAALVPWLDRDPVVLDAFVERARDEPMESWWTTRALVPVSPLPEPLRAALVDVLISHWGEEATRTVEALTSELPLDAWVREAFLDLLDDRHLAVEVAAGLAAHVEHPEIREALIDRLSEPDARIRYWATHALATTATDDAIAPLLRQMLDDEDDEIRSAAAFGLIRRDDEPEAWQTLRAITRGEGWLARSVTLQLENFRRDEPSTVAPDVDSTASAVESPIGDPATALADRTVELHHHSTSLDLLVEVHERLVPYLHTASPIGEYLRELSRDPGADVPERLRVAIAELLDPNLPIRTWFRPDMVGLRILPHLVPNDPDDPIAIAHAIRTTPIQLSRRKDRQTVIERLDHPDPIVRSVAVEALLPAVAKADIRSLVIERLTTDDFPVRLATARNLCRVSDRSQISKDLWEHLEPWLAVDVDPAWTRVEFGHPHEVRDAMARRLGQRAQRDAATRRRLVDQLRADRFAVRLGAVLGLLEWPGGPPSELHPTIIEALVDRRGHESLDRRLDAASALVERSEWTAEIVELCDEAAALGTRPWESLWAAPTTRQRAAQMLGRLATRDRPGLRDRLLELARHDRHPDVRDAAYEALKLAENR